MAVMEIAAIMTIFITAIITNICNIVNSLMLKPKIGTRVPPVQRKI